MTNKELIEETEKQIKLYKTVAELTGKHALPLGYLGKIDYHESILKQLSDKEKCECKYCEEYGTKMGPQFYIEFTRLITPKTFDDYMIDADFCPKCGRELKA